MLLWLHHYIPVHIYFEVHQHLFVHLYSDIILAFESFQTWMHKTFIYCNSLLFQEKMYKYTKKVHSHPDRTVITCAPLHILLYVSIRCQQHKIDCRRAKFELIVQICRFIYIVYIRANSLFAPIQLHQHLYHRRPHCA